MRKIIFTNRHGGLSVTTPCRNVREEHMTEEEIEMRAFNKLPEGANNPKFINASDVPKDRTFRGAWEDVGGKPVHNIPKAKLLAHDMRRKNRDAEMKPFDDIISLQIPGEDGVMAESERKKIRDKYATLQEAIDVATTVEELKANI